VQFQNKISKYCIEQVVRSSFSKVHLASTSEMSEPVSDLLVAICVVIAASRSKT